MTAIALTVNGRAVDASVDPRTHLADFLREQHHFDPHTVSLITIVLNIGAICGGLRCRDVRI